MVYGAAIVVIFSSGSGPTLIVLMPPPDNASSTTKADDYTGGLNPTVHNASSAVLTHLYSILKNKSDDGGC